MSQTIDGDTVSSYVASYENTLSQVSVKAVGSQVAVMTGISVSPWLRSLKYQAHWAGRNYSRIFVFPAKGEEGVYSRSVNFGQ